MSVGADKEAIAHDHAASNPDRLLRLVTRAALSLTVAAGMLHLFNLVGWGRWQLGPFMLTPFRAAFIVSWLLLIAGMVRQRRLPRLDALDAAVIIFALAYAGRALFTPETLGIAANWLVTAAGVYFLVKLVVRDRADLRAVLISIVASVVLIAAFGLVEYAAKANPLFDSIEVTAIGADSRISASGQFYRVRSLVGHPGFTAAVLTAAVPLAMLLLWRRPVAMAAAVVALLGSLFLTFSRGSWLLAALIFIPLALVLYRSSVRRYLQWAALAALVAAAVLAALYWTRGEAYIDFTGSVQESGVRWSRGTGAATVISEEGIMPQEYYVYADVDAQTFGEAPGAATVVVHYRDEGLGVLRVDYLPASREPGETDDWRILPRINKTDTGNWTNAAFYLDQPLFEGHPYNADIRVVDEDNSSVISRVEVHAGRMDPVSQVVHQWEARSASLSTRFETYPLAWDTARANPLGVGPFNSPGTDHHAVDSLPLTWLMEFGWAGALVAAALALLVVRESYRVATTPWAPASVIFLAALTLILHGGHLMILYDKPSIVMLSALAALYSLTRAVTPRGPAVEAGFSDCYL